MSLFQKIFRMPVRPLILLLTAAALGGCAVQLTPTLVEKQLPPMPTPPTSLPEKEVQMVTATLPPGVPTQALPIETPTFPETPTRPAPAQNASPSASVVLQAPEFIEYLLWPSPDQLLAVSTGSSVYPVDLQSPAIGEKVQWRMPENGGPIAFLADGSRVAVLNGSGMVGVFAPQPDGTLTQVGSLLVKANNASFSADGKTLLLTDPEKTQATLYSIESGAPIKQLKGFAEGDPVYTALLSPNGKTVAWRSRGALQFQDVQSEALSPLIKTQGMITDARFAPDGGTLAAVVGDQLEVYSAADGKQLTRQQLSQPTPSLAYSPDGSLLAAAYGTGVQVWDTRTWLPLAPLTGHAAPVMKVSFSPDGKTLVSADEKGELRLWSLRK